MAFVIKDRVFEYTTTTGTGTLTLAGTKSGYQQFATVGNGNTTYYTIVAENGDWESGIGTYTSSGTTLARTTVLSSSNSNNLVNFAAGTKEVFSSLPASGFVEKLSSSANLQDLTDASSARSNLGLGTSAVANIVDGSSAGGNGVLQAYPSVLEIGRSGSGDRTVTVDLVASGAPGTVDRSARVIRFGGVDGLLQIANSGTGAIELSNPNGIIKATSSANGFDTTNGRILTAGNFGLGLSLLVATNSEDTTTTGFYRSGTVTTNVPVTANGGQCIVINWGNDTHVNQLWFDHNSNPNDLAYHKIMWKIKRGGVWATNPVELLHSENGVYKSEVATSINDLSLTKIGLVNTAGRIQPIVLTSSDDLNALVSVGDYSWNNANTPINAPVASIGGRLEIRKTSDGTYLDQQFFSYNNTTSYRRTTNNNGSTWTAWKQLAFVDSSITGNAATATALQNARTINGTSFDGTASITTSSWGTSRTLSFTGDVTGTNSVNGSGNVATALTIATSSVTHAKYQNIPTQRLLGRGATGTGNVEEISIGSGLDLSTSGVLTNSAPNVVQTTITGNAGSATILQTSRTINGTGFNGSANITTANWGTARNLQVDLAKNTATSVNGSANVTDIGVQGTLPIANGGTGATTASAARTALGLGAAAIAEIHTNGNNPSSSDVLSAAPENIEINRNGSGNRTSFIDFHSRDGTDFDARIIKNSGVNGTFEIISTDGTVSNVVAFQANSQLVQFNYGSDAGVEIYKYAPAGGGISGLVRVHANGTTVGASYADYYYNGSPIGSIAVASASSVNYNTSSDYRLKDNIQPMVESLNRIMAIAPVSYTWKSDDSYGEGFIAHELAEIVPVAVTGSKDAVDTEGNPKYQQVDYSKLVPLLTKGIQDLVAEINTLKQRIENAE